MFKTKAFPLLTACALSCPASAEQRLPALTEALLPVGSDLYAVAIGPGGPGEEFGSDATNGRLYRIDPGGAAEEIRLSDGHGVGNPAGIVRAGSQIVIVDGNQVISTALDGSVNCRQVPDVEGVFSTTLKCSTRVP
ncbi:hypothetical protein ACFMBG_18310 [Leisingera sp. D0M16]|uniref:hypothetical protein n=1 Tax=Leisingera coralii TaxID=3351347 RepID=UPI003B7BDD39